MSYISFRFSLRTHPLSPIPAARTARFVWQMGSYRNRYFSSTISLSAAPRGLARQGLSLAMRLCLYQGLVYDRPWFQYLARALICRHARPRHTWMNYRNSRETSSALKHALLLPFKDLRPPDHSQHHKKYRFARYMTPEYPSRRPA